MNLSVFCARTARAAATDGLSCSTVSEALRRNKLGFGFSAGGLLFPYYIGTVEAFIHDIGSIFGCAYKSTDACMPAAVQASLTSSPSSRSSQVRLRVLYLKTEQVNLEGLAHGNGGVFYLQIPRRWLGLVRAA